MTARVRVLVVDDDADVRAAVGDLIRLDERFELVGTAGSLDDALEQAAAGTPDVALMDVRMRPSGATTTRALLSRFPGVKVVALSAFDDRGAVLQMVEAGAVGYVVKGSSARTIREAVLAVMRGDTPLSGAASSEMLRELAGRLGAEREERAGRERRVARLRRAMASTAVVFQPVVDLQTREPAGFEALTRFPDPALSTLEWFHEAAALGLAGELERHSARAAIDAARTAGLPSTAFLAVNVSPHSVGDWVESLASRLGPHRLVLELTEHTPVEDYQALEGVLAPLRARGVLVAVDDVGAGFASLRHILRIAPDLIKLDASLTQGLVDGRGGRAMTAALVALAAEAGCQVIAEGVEGPDQVQALRELGVPLGQGYHLGMPAGLGAAPA